MEEFYLSKVELKMCVTVLRQKIRNKNTEIGKREDLQKIVEKMVKYIETETF